MKPRRTERAKRSRGRTRPAFTAAILVCAGLSFSNVRDGAPAGAAITRVAPPGGPRVIGFYVPDPATGAAKPLPDSTLAGLTHLITYVSVSGGSCSPSAGQSALMDQLQGYQARSPSLRVLLSLSLGASGFHQTAADPVLRKQVAASCAALVSARGFNGFDIDWEFPVGDQDRDNLTAFMADLRAALDALGGPHDDLTIDTIADWFPNLPPNYDFAGMAQSVDWFNVMDYDLLFIELAGGKTSINTPLDTPDGAVDPGAKVPTIKTSVLQYRLAGVPDDKFVMGVAFYAYQFFGVDPGNNGLWQPFDRSIPGSGAEIDYRQVAAGPLNTSIRTWNAGAASPWLWDPSTRTAISYDDAESITAKVRFEQQQHLGGVMIWHIMADDDNHTLFNALNAAMNEPVPPDSTTTTSTTAVSVPSSTSEPTATPPTPVSATPAFTG